MNRMRHFFVFLLGINALLCGAQSSDTLIIQSSLNKAKWFSYRVITQEYITNVNDYFLDLKLDTFYMVVKNTDVPSEYKITYHQDEKYSLPVKKNDPLLRSEYHIRFDSRSGKAVELLNWKQFRDQMLSDLSFQAANKLISSAEFEDYKQLLNTEPLVRKTVMHDITYLFSIYGDTVRLDAEYMKIKPVRSPMSGKDYAILGSFTSEIPAGTRNTVVFHARNKAGELEKPELMEEVKAYLYKTYPKDSPIPELTAVGLNSEMDWQYNRLQKQMLRISLSDVLAINGQSRGNIRTFDLWERE